MGKNKIQVLILAGGRGERLKPLTEKIPKPLIKINDKPFLGYQINYFEEKYNINDFIIATGYKSNLIDKYILESYNHLKIETVDSGDVDIIERIRSCSHLLDDKFLLCYGDTLADIDLDLLFDFHSNHLGSATITSYQLNSQFGIVKFDKNGLVSNFIEKPKLDEWINIGFMILDKKILDHNQEKTFSDFLSSIALQRKLFCHRHKGLHITINTLSELKEAEKDIKLFNEVIKIK